MHQRIIIKDENILYISKSSIDDSFSSSPHSHNNLEILYVIENEGKIITTNSTYKIKENDLVIINPNTSHYETGKNLMYYAIGIKDLDIFLKESYSKDVLIDDGENISYIFDLIFENASKSDDESYEIIRSSFNIIYNILKRKYRISNVANNNYSDIVNKIKNIIDNYFSSNIKLDEIAKRLNSSTSLICHKFKEETGKTIIEYKINKQLEESYNLLKVSTMNVNDISNLVGFNNVSYFNKLFKNKYGKTPKEIKI